MNEIRVALIEDHDLTRLGLRTVLNQQNGISVIGEAATGTEGLKLLTTAQADIAIVDIGLPDMDGIELIRRFKKFLTASEIDESTATKILILTMQDSENAVLAAFAAGADSYCMKNLEVDHLLKALRSTCEGDHWIDPAIARIVLQHNRQIQTVKDASPKREQGTVAIATDEAYYSQVLKATPLTSRELGILELIVAGYSNAEIADKCYITVGTVKTHVRNILNKLCADDRTQAAVRALRGGLVM